MPNSLNAKIPVHDQRKGLSDRRGSARARFSIDNPPDKWELGGGVF